MPGITVLRRMLQERLAYIAPLASKARANFVEQGGKWSSKEDFEVTLEPTPDSLT